MSFVGREGVGLGGSSFNWWSSHDGLTATIYEMTPYQGSFRI